MIGVFFVYFIVCFVFGILCSMLRISMVLRIDSIVFSMNVVLGKFVFWLVVNMFVVSSGLKMFIKLLRLVIVFIMWFCFCLLIWCEIRFCMVGCVSFFSVFIISDRYSIGVLWVMFSIMNFRVEVISLVMMVCCLLKWVMKGEISFVCMFVVSRLYIVKVILFCSGD